MDTDNKFKAFMRVHLDERTYDRLVNKYEHLSQITFLITISTEIFPEAISILIEGFLAGLSFEEASKYVNADNNTNPLIFCCSDIKLVERVIKYVHDINICGQYGSTALMYACIRSNLDIVQFYLDHGANVNAKNSRDETALLWLCANDMNENIERIIELFIFSGVDPLIKSIDGLTAYDYVRNKSALSMRSQQLLQGAIRMNNTKRAT